MLHRKTGNTFKIIFAVAFMWTVIYQGSKTQESQNTVNEVTSITSLSKEKKTQVDQNIMNEVTGFASLLSSKKIQVDQNTVNEVTSFPSFSKEKIHDCLERSLNGVSFVICVKHPNVDEFQSKSIIQGTLWEEGIIKHEMLAMQKYPQAIFLDLGSNIGAHGLPIAAMNRTVVAVDAIYGNLAFISQSRILNKEKYADTGSIRFLYNAVSDHQERLYPMTLNEKNEGGTNLLTEDQLESGKYDKSKMSGPPVDSVTTLEIIKWINAKQVIMKIDVEGFECQALSDEVLNQSTGTFIPYIFMEWMQIKENLAGRCPHHEELEKRLYKNGYVPKNPDIILNRELHTNSETWNDVLWVHQ